MFSRPIHVVACVRSSLLFMAEEDAVVWTRRVLFNHPAVKEDSGCFHFLAVMSNAATDVHYSFLCKHMLSFLLGVYVAVECLGHVVTLCWKFWKTAWLFSKVTTRLHIPSSIWEVQLLQSLPVLVIIWLFDVRHPSGCKHLIFLWFWLAFLWWLMRLNTLLCLLAVCVSSLEKCLFRWLAHSLIRSSLYHWVVRVPYIFQIPVPYQLPFCGVSVHFLDGIIAVEKLFILM